jgi:hypothetical protein
MDVKQMFPAADGSTGFLIIIDDISNYTKAVAIKNENAKTIATIIINDIILETGPPKRIRSDLGRAMDNEIARHIATALNYDLTFVSVQSHHSLKAERYISTIQNILIANLRSTAHLWPIYLKPSVFAMNIHATPSLQGFSPFEIHFKTPPPSVDKFDIHNLAIPCGSFHEYLQQVKTRFEQIQKVITHARQLSQDKRLITTSRKSTAPTLNTGSLVYLLAPNKTELHTTNRKITLHYIGPYIIYAMLNGNNCLLVDLFGTIIRNVFHIKRLKPAYLRSGNGSIITTREELKTALKLDTEPTMKQFRHALEAKNITIMGNDTLTDTPAITNAYVNMPHISPIGDINIQLGKPRVQTRKQLSPGDYALIRTRFKHGDLQLLLSLSTDPSDRKQSFYINFTEIPHVMTSLDDTAIKHARRVGRPANLR